MRTRVIGVACTLMLIVPPPATAHADPPGGACLSQIRPAPIIEIEPCDSVHRIVAKAAHVVPTPEQVAWQHREVLAFTHFGIITSVGLHTAVPPAVGDRP